jgi:uncharacterized membrane protein
MGSRHLMIVVLVTIGVIVLLPILGMLMWRAGMMGPWTMGDGMVGWRPGWLGGLSALTPLLLIAVVLIILALTRKEPKDQTPLELLKYRLAKGEISKQQYEELKEVL